MADGINLTEGSGKVAATDDVGGVHHQRIKITDGEADSSTPVHAGGGVEANALRVTVASDSTGVLGIAAGSNIIGATLDAGPSWTQVFGVSGAGFTSADASIAAAVTDAPTGGQKLVIDDVFISVDTAMQVDLEIETAGTIFFSIHMAANTAYQFTPRGKFKLPIADKKLMVDTDAAGNISVLAFYHSEI